MRNTRLAALGPWSVGCAYGARKFASFNPKPEAMASGGMDLRLVAPAIASGFGLNDLVAARGRIGRRS